MKAESHRHLLTTGKIRTGFNAEGAELQGFKKSYFDVPVGTLSTNGLSRAGQTRHLLRQSDTTEGQTITGANYWIESPCRLREANIFPRLS